MQYKNIRYTVSYVNEANKQLKTNLYAIQLEKSMCVIASTTQEEAIKEFNNIIDIIKQK